MVTKIALLKDGVIIEFRYCRLWAALVTSLKTAEQLESHLLHLARLGTWREVDNDSGGGDGLYVTMEPIIVGWCDWCDSNTNWRL